MILLLLACTQKEVEAPSDIACDTPDKTSVVVLNQIRFGRRDEQSHAWGFDLDHRVSDASDSEGCFKEDLLSPDGTPGIDSAFSGLVPALEKTEASAVEGLIQDAINSGELLVALELEDFDSREKDTCTNLNIVRAVGPPLLGTDGYLEPGLTYDRSEDYQPARVEGVTVEDGKVTAGPVTWALPLHVLDAEVNLVLRDGYIHYEFAEDGSGSGYMGGGVEVSEILDLLANINSDVGDILNSLLEAAADLKPGEDGTCGRLSAVIEFQTTSGFFYAP